MTVGTTPPSVFDADLPVLTYDPSEAPAVVYPRIQAAQQEAPVALGSHRFQQLVELGSRARGRSPSTAAVSRPQRHGTAGR
jgi:hypothetical protein